MWVTGHELPFLASVRGLFYNVTVHTRMQLVIKEHLCSEGSYRKTRFAGDCDIHTCDYELVKGMCYQCVHDRTKMLRVSERITELNC